MAGGICAFHLFSCTNSWKTDCLSLGVCKSKMGLLMQEKASCSSSDGSTGDCCRKHAMQRKRARIQLLGFTHLSFTLWLQLRHFHYFNNLNRISLSSLFFQKDTGQQTYCFKNLGRLGSTNFNFTGKTLYFSFQIPALQWQHSQSKIILRMGCELLMIVCV